MASLKNPFGLLSKFNRQVEDALEDEGNYQGALGRWTPRSDIYQHDDEVIIEMDLPGVKRDKLDVSMQGNRLNVRGVRDETQEESRNYYRKERLMGSFRRTFNVSRNVDEENIRAQYDDGVLSITIPIRDSDGSQSVDIA